jgi:predicted RecA/RadA family phage recombinase
MALSPSLLTTLKADGFRVPIPAGTTYSAGDIVPIGPSLVCQAACDYNWNGSTSNTNSGNLVGIVTVPSNSAAIAAGVKLAWNSTANIASASASTAVTQYPLGISVAAATTAQTTVDVLMWPGSGLGS